MYGGSGHSWGLQESFGLGSGSSENAELLDWCLALLLDWTEIRPGKGCTRVRGAFGWYSEAQGGGNTEGLLETHFCFSQKLEVLF